MLTFFYLTKDKESSIALYQTQKIEKLKDEYTIILDNYKVTTSILFDEVVNKEEILKILQNINSKDKEVLEKTRKELFNKLQPFYERLSGYNFRQFHFHTKNSDSFLRFHRPQKYGDSLKGIRYTIEETNRLKIPIYGFEEGRIYNGFRNLYPISYKGEHLGSVEISLPFSVIKNQLEKNFNSQYFFMIEREIVDKKVFESERKKFYLDTFSNDFYFEKGLVLQKEYSDALKDNDVLNKLNKRESFVVVESINNQNYLFSFLPIKNVQNQIIAYIVSFSKDELIDKIEKDFFLKMVIFNLIMLSIIIFDISRRKSKQTDFVQNVIDSQENMLLITSKTKVIDANRAFMKFFNVMSLQEFGMKYECLCKVLIKEDGFIYKDTFVELVEELLKNGSKKEKIKIYDKYNECEKIFLIKVINLDNNLYLLSMVDITILEKEKELLHHMSTTDFLTKIPNRSKFDIDVDNLFKDSVDFTLIMIDIDFFKQINDNYGHQVGDTTLKELTLFVKKQLDSDSMMYRWGGEEFFVLTTKPYKEAVELAKSLRVSIENNRFYDVGKITCSFGVSNKKDGDSKKELLQRVDNALYEAKLTGRNKVVDV
jgi:diguanylate cyclase (GGDEF)-like protein